uniref:RNA binding motif protein 45 n=1 Tax=Anolis carolinensis TaxID=28377 RepID=A0A803T2R4_ANOCA|nr:PREDICTED: RNA-binding protein 45 [Anolis carolinensis]|eukprot:XP_008116424.1 PREDICTED: RNA-binding protein 45 [Anolis carolinensis]
MFGHKAIWAESESMSPGTSEPRKESSEVQGRDFVPLGYSTTPEFVKKAPEYHVYKYYDDSMDYRTLTYEPVTKSPESSVHYSYMSNTEQETDHHRIEECSVLTSVESLDIASEEKSETRSPDSVFRSLLVVSEFPFEKQQLVSLLNLIPGMEYCEMSHGLYSSRVYAVVQYNNAASAIYAKHKLHGFEYPSGNWLIVTFIEEGTVQRNLIKSAAKQKPSTSSYRRLQTDAELPSSKGKAPSDSPVRERLYITFNPYPLPEDILEDILSRFGHFINVHFIPGENTAYATFAEESSVIDAIAVLHGKTVNGVKLEMKLAVLPRETPVNAKGLSDQVSHFKTA